MSMMDIKELNRKVAPSVTGELLRGQLVDLAKNFKTSWVQLGQALYPVWKDKLFFGWGHDKFEQYTQKELGLKKTTALKLLKTYFFVEQEEPAYLHEEYAAGREAGKVPDYDTINVLRLARAKKELEKEDYIKLRKAVFEKGRNDTLVRKDLTQLMKQRKEVDPEEERDKRNKESIRKLVTAIKNFQKDMTALKLSVPELVLEAESLMKRLEKELE
ncbi:MAG TPA: hypothetical protein PLT76_07090 [Candidatus Omnitrophota bacterium]|nr:hypothetical protein [Candidatus Omnitrophota bacterium]HQO58471.1 hypothetical protein [Candidatus Omnitrophota bacterium]HQP12823.1 hypothetical protein [Candidatus Omnitrophota bacterium]